MSRRLFLDRSAGEARGVVLLDGKPERLLIERDDDLSCQKLGATMTGRVTLIERGLATAFVQLPAGPDGVLPLRADAHLVEGASIEVVVTAEARRGKGPALRLVGPSSGPPRLIREGPDIEARLSTLAPGTGIVITDGDEAREAADEAQEAAMAVVHPLAGGGSIAIEPTRALVAVDVDLGDRGGGDPRRAARKANLLAIAETARILRLKGLSGLVVIDLVGRGHDGPAMSDQARRAFAPDGAGVAIGPISRFGLFELSVPRSETPVVERLLDEAGRPSPQSMALALLRAMEREGRANPGSRLEALAAPEVASVARTYESRLAARIGPRFTIRADTALVRSRFEVRSL